MNKLMSGKKLNVHMCACACVSECVYVCARVCCVYMNVHVCAYDSMCMCLSVCDAAMHTFWASLSIKSCI